MGPVGRDRSPEPITGVERSLEVKLGSLGGFELRPTRLFLWKGPERAASEKVVPIGERPAALDYERHETTTRAGGVELRALGNPLMTIALAGVIAFKKWAEGDESSGAGERS
jgi:hypothetical protein